jgi:hypothetical protein
MSTLLPNRGIEVVLQVIAQQGKAETRNGIEATKQQKDSSMHMVKIAITASLRHHDTHPLTTKNTASPKIKKKMCGYWNGWKAMHVEAVWSCPCT